MTETPQPESSPGTHHRGGAIGIAIIVAILMLMFVLPGFIAGLYSKATGSRTNMFYIRHDPVATAFFYPASKVADLSPAIQQFYVWEFRAAGGKFVLFAM